MVSGAQADQRVTDLRVLHERICGHSRTRFGYGTQQNPRGTQVPGQVAVLNLLAQQAAALVVKPRRAARHEDARCSRKDAMSVPNGPASS